MEPMPVEAGECARLNRVRDHVRALTSAHAWLKEGMRNAFADFQLLVGEFARQQRFLRDRRRWLARELLAAGYLIDLQCCCVVRERGDDDLLRDCGLIIDGRVPAFTVRFSGLCPVGLVREFGRLGPGDVMTEELRAAALAAFDWDEEWRGSDLRDDQRDAMVAERGRLIEAGTHTERTWEVIVSKPADWHEPINPYSLDHADLRRLPDTDYRTVVLFRLGGLADAGDTRLIVAAPTPTGHFPRDILPAAAWDARIPVEDALSIRVAREDLPLLAQALPGDTAERMLAHLLEWVAERVAKARQRETPDELAPPGLLRLPPAREVVVLWEGAEPTARNVRLARTRTAYLEAHGVVTEALIALERSGHRVGKSTFYDHLAELDVLCPGWRTGALVSGAPGIPETGVQARALGKSRGMSR